MTQSKPTDHIDRAFIASELDDSAKKRDIAQADMQAAQGAIQRGQQALNDATQRFIAHDAVIQALTAILAKKGPEDAKPDPAAPRP